MSTICILLQPFQLKHLALKNRIMSTAHEPAYSEDGLPKDRYRLYHVEKAKGGIALTMTAGSAIVAEDSPAAFGNLHAYKDEIVPWLEAARRRLPRRRLRGDDPDHPSRPAHQLEQGATGCRCWRPRRSASRRTARSPRRPRTGTSTASSKAYAAAAAAHAGGGPRRHRARGLRPSLDGFWSPATNRRTDEYGGSLDNRLRFTFRGARRDPRRGRPDFIVGIRMVADEDWESASPARKGSRSPPPGRARHGRLPQHHPRPHRDRRRALQVIPDPRHALGAAPRLRRRGRAATASRCSTPPASTTSRPRATRSPPASSTWSA